MPTEDEIYSQVAEQLCRGMPGPSRAGTRRRPGAAALGISLGAPPGIAPPPVGRRKTIDERYADYPSRVIGALEAGRTPPREPAEVDNDPNPLRQSVREYEAEQLAGQDPADVEASRQKRLRRGDEPASSPPGQGPPAGLQPGAGAAGPTVHARIRPDGSAAAAGVLEDLLSLPPLSLQLPPGDESTFLGRLYTALTERRRSGTPALAGPRPGSTPPTGDRTWGSVTEAYPRHGAMP
jgi:hypothetical protein